MKTKERLAKVLTDAGLNEPDPNGKRLLLMAVRAEQGYYDDYESPLATNIVQLVTDLRACGRADLAERAKAGEWDCTKEEGEAWFEANKTDPEIKSLFSLFPEIESEVLKRKR